MQGRRCTTAPSSDGLSVGLRVRRNTVPSTRPDEASGTERLRGVAERLGMSDAAEVGMPDKKTIERARKDARQGKSPSTQAGEFVREEMEHTREGKHGARSSKQAIAIGLSKARRAGVRLPP